MKRWIFAPVAIIILATGSPLQAKTVNDLDVTEQAEQSPLFGTLNKIQASEVLQTIIREGQHQRIMLKYVGIDPRILANVHVDQIDLRFRKFDQFSTDPVGWNREGAQMNDFKAKWSAITNVSCQSISNDDGMDYFALYFHAADRGAMTLVPLQNNPGGYSINDALLAALVLQNSIEAATTTRRDIPPPTTVSTAHPDSEITPTSTPMPSPLPPPTARPLPTAQPLPDAQPSPTAVSLSPTPIPPTATDPQKPPVATPLEQQLPSTPLQKLQTLKQLFDEGLIDREVYLEKQRSILEQL